MQVVVVRQCDRAEKVVGAVDVGRFSSVGNTERERAGASQCIGSIDGICTDFQSADCLVVIPKINLRTVRNQKL